MGSDGIFDNLYDEDILYCINKNLDFKTFDLKDLQRTADCLSFSAEVKGYDPNYDSPFSKEARAHGRKHKGGKPDDITVIVSQVKFH